MKKKIIFLDFDGVMETIFQLPLEEAMKVKYDKYGPMFDDECVNNLRRIISATNAEVVVANSWKPIILSVPHTLLSISTS